MNKEEMNKYAYKLMIKNNQEEAIKNLMLLDKLREENKEQEEYIKYWQNEYDKKCEVIDKAIDQLYCWGEVIRPDIQLSLLEILKGENNE